MVSIFMMIIVSIFIIIIFIIVVGFFVQESGFSFRYLISMYKRINISNIFLVSGEYFDRLLNSYIIGNSVSSKNAGLMRIFLKFTITNKKKCPSKQIGMQIFSTSEIGKLGGYFENLDLKASMCFIISPVFSKWGNYWLILSFFVTINVDSRIRNLAMLPNFWNNRRISVWSRKMHPN